MDNVKCRALGEVFECKGMKLRVVRGVTCAACVFHAPNAACKTADMGINGIVGPCAGVMRKDGRDIIFILEED